jgi:hypothetical protein
MYIPFTELELALTSTALLAGAYYLGHHLGFKTGAIATVAVLQEQGYIDIEYEEPEDEDTDRED